VVPILGVSLHLELYSLPDETDVSLLVKNLLKVLEFLFMVPCRVEPRRMKN